jgi:hypothetical protein
MMSRGGEVRRKVRTGPPVPMTWILVPPLIGLIARVWIRRSPAGMGFISGPIRAVISMRVSSFSAVGI